MRSIVSVIVLSLLSGSALAADSREESLRGLIKRLPPPEQGFFEKAKYAGHYALDQLVTYSNLDGRLWATFHLPDGLVRQFADPAPLLISVEGSPHVWSVHRRSSGTLDTKLSMTTLTCYAPDEVWPFNRFAVSSDGNAVLVSAGQMFGHPNAQQTLALGQSERVLRLNWRIDADGWKPKRLDIADMKQLPQRAPAVMEKYLLPVLRRLGPARSASDVYRVFDQIPADPKVTAAIGPLISRLDSDDGAVRDAAAARLKAMGRAGTLACLRLDPATLSPEQKNRLAAFYAAEGWIHVSDLEAARNDEAFLASCAEDQDEAVRTAASSMLAAIRAAKQLRFN
jgi:hypothetical protein